MHSLLSSQPGYNTVTFNWSARPCPTTSPAYAQKPWSTATHAIRTPHAQRDVTYDWQVAWLASPTASPINDPYTTRFHQSSSYKHAKKTSLTAIARTAHNQSIFQHFQLPCTRLPLVSLLPRQPSTHAKRPALHFTPPILPTKMPCCPCCPEA